MTDTASTKETPAADAPKGYRVGSIADQSTGQYEALHPITGAPLGAFFTLRGPEHPQRKAVMHRLMRDARERAASGSPQDPADDEAEALALLADNIVGWSGVLHPSTGAPMPWTPEAARELVNDPEQQWLVDQLITATRRRALFIKA